jgi:hypothetical protein
MPHRGMASLASVGLAHTTVALGLLSVAHHTSRLRSSREGEGLRRGTLEGRAGRDFSKRRSEDWRANEGILAGDSRVVTRLKPEAFS